MYAKRKLASKFGGGILKYEKADKFHKKKIKIFQRAIESYEKAVQSLGKNSLAYLQECKQYSVSHIEKELFPDSIVTKQAELYTALFIDALKTLEKELHNDIANGDIIEAQINLNKMERTCQCRLFNAHMQLRQSQSLYNLSNYLYRRCSG